MRLLNAHILAGDVARHEHSDSGKPRTFVLCEKKHEWVCSNASTSLKSTLLVRVSLMCLSVKLHSSRLHFVKCKITWLVGICLCRKYVVTQQHDAPAEPSPSPKYISLQLPYFGSESKNTRQELSSFVRHKDVMNVKLRCFQSTRKLQSWFSVKDRQAIQNRFNVVYKLTCSCGASYVA